MCEVIEVGGGGRKDASSSGHTGERECLSQPHTHEQCFKQRCEAHLLPSARQSRSPRGVGLALLSLNSMNFSSSTVQFKLDHFFFLSICKKCVCGKENCCSAAIIIHISRSGARAAR